MAAGKPLNFLGGGCPPGKSKGGFCGRRIIPSPPTVKNHSAGEKLWVACAYLRWKTYATA